MPTWSSPNDFLGTLNKIQRDIARAQSKATREMAETAERVLVSEARRDLGGDSRFSGWSGRDLADLRIKRGRKVDTHWIYPTRKSGGPWKVAEVGRNKGNATGRGGVALFYGPGLNKTTGQTSYTKTGKVRRPRAYATRRWNGYTAGKSTASRAVSRFEKHADDIADKAMRTAVKMHFDVT